MTKSTSRKPICLDTPPPGSDQLLVDDWTLLSDTTQRFVWYNHRAGNPRLNSLTLIKIGMYDHLGSLGLPRDAQHRLVLSYLGTISLEESMKAWKGRQAHATAGGKARPKLAETRAELLEQMFTDSELTAEDRDQLRPLNYETQQVYCTKVMRMFESWLPSSGHRDAKLLAGQCRDRKHWQAILRALKWNNRL